MGWPLSIYGRAFCCVLAHLLHPFLLFSVRAGRQPVGNFLDAKRYKTGNRPPETFLLFLLPSFPFFASPRSAAEAILERILLQPLVFPLLVQKELRFSLLLQGTSADVCLAKALSVHFYASINTAQAEVFAVFSRTRPPFLLPLLQVDGSIDSDFVCRCCCFRFCFRSAFFCRFDMVFSRFCISSPRIFV